MIEIRFANQEDSTYLAHKDHHIPAEVIAMKIKDGEIIVVLDGRQQIGWLRFSYFWDLIPFMNMLWIEENYSKEKNREKIS